MAGVKTEMIKQAIVRHIADNRLKRGDRLPSQNDFRHNFKVGATTIGSALKELADDNVLEMRDKVGVFVKEGGLDGHTGRTVAILVNISNSIYTHIMVSRLQEYLQGENCRNLVFTCPGDKCSQRLKNYPGLLRSIRQQEITGMLITCEIFEEEYRFLDQTGIEYLSTLINRNGFNSCPIDGERFINEALAYLVARGARRPAVFSLGVDPQGVFPKSFIQAFSRHCPSVDYRQLYFTGSGFEHSRLIVEKLLAQAPAERPDAFIFTGDLIMQGISVWLYRLQEGMTDKYLPPAAAMLNKQNPIFPLFNDLAIFELDINEQARIAVNALMEGIRNDSPILSLPFAARLVTQEKYFENSMIPETVYE